LSCLLLNLTIEPLAEMLRCSDLKGLTVPGSEERLIANLFADNTTTFLDENDDFNDLMCLLDTWCLASGACFNVMKTQIIPISSKDFCLKLSTCWKAKDNFNEILRNIHIVKEKEVIQILGAWFGNNIPEDMGEAANDCLNYDSDWSPCQYLTVVQGMLKHVKNKLKKQVWKFIWEGKTKNLVDFETLKASRSQGGLDILDLHAWNKAIEAMWVKSLL
ncbi:uncharacterized protein EV420DRAFT_1245710, partial [Desarmillaria tabescens]